MNPHADLCIVTPPLAPTRLGLLVEDQARVRSWLVQLMGRAFPDMTLVVAPSLRTARSWLYGPGPRSANFTLAILDLGLPDGSGIELVREIADGYPGVLPVVATIYDDDAHLFDAIAAGARGYLLKDEEDDLLLAYLRRIEAGEPPLSPSIAHRMISHFRQQPRTAPNRIELSARENQVLALLARGMTVREAAAQLGLTEHTVAGYIKTLYQKLNISTRAQAALEAVKRNLV